MALVELGLTREVAMDEKLPVTWGKKAVSSEAARAQIVSAPGASMVYSPYLKERPGRALQVLGERDNPSVVPWGFWGAVMLAGLLAAMIVFRGTSGLQSMWDLLWVMLAVVAGSVMLKLGKKTSLEEHLLCELDLMRGIVTWPVQGTELAVTFDEVEELVFGMTHYPISSDGEGTRVHAFSLLLRDAQGRLVPIVEASPNKGETHQIGQVFARVLEVPLTYVGMGIK
ncbi:hypothetical protein EA187_03000 [Lujinxingia sediminis]|uniref:Uncharacterized protein n=1 Tax=Lujinxingia sediminis TaxID=2480984 RepID=A0ABY0CWZ3_9DELT|nr:hypothetical protein [Lujinxingia sediminis]RVU48417.1 hypothetical protein EA187_03000 [Lujinxingia sediminis]